MNEKDARKVREHVLRVMREVGAGELRTDELSVYEHMVPQEHHSICLAHWRKSKCRRARQLARQLKQEGLQFESQDMLKSIELLRQEPRPPTLPEAVEFFMLRPVKGWETNHSHMTTSFFMLLPGTGRETIHSQMTKSIYMFRSTENSS